MPDEHFDTKKYRDMSKIKQPHFLSPKYFERVPRGNQECACLCKSVALPRNAILVRPFKTQEASDIYTKLVENWKEGKFKNVTYGSCQQIIK